MQGAAELAFATRDGRTGISRLYQRDPLRVLSPLVRPGEPPLAVLLTTSGGLVAGDRLDLKILARQGVSAVVTTQAAEKIYRSNGEACRIETRIEVGARAWLEWMPQETILFDRARLRRTTRIDARADGRLMAGEILVFGRLARGETLTEGLLQDAWEIRRDGRLIWAESLRLDGDIAAQLTHPACFDGAVACATMLYLGEDAPSRLDFARHLLSEYSHPHMRAGATAIGPLLVVRWLSRDASCLRRGYGEFWAAFRHHVAGLPTAIPRLWQI